MAMVKKFALLAACVSALSGCWGSDLERGAAGAVVGGGMVAASGGNSRQIATGATAGALVGTLADEF